MARRKGRARTKKAAARPPATRSYTIGVELACVEMVRGHDGILRGMPEPGLVVGVFRVGGGPVVLLARGKVVLRLSAASFPVIVECDPDARELVRTRAMLGVDQSLVILAIAVEVDGGRDLAMVYGALQDPGALRVWDPDADMPSPVALDEMALRPTPALVRPVHAILGDDELGKLCRDDELVGVCVAPRERRSRSEELRLPFRSADGKNEWTAVLDVVVR